MEIKKTKCLTDIQFQQINQLWNDEFPVSLKDRFGGLLDGVDRFHHYLIEDENRQILAWAVDFEKDAERRFSVIVAQSEQGKGLGTLLVEKLKESLGEFYGWVIDHSNDKKQDGTFYHSPLPFYIKQGFEILHGQRIDNDLLKAVKIKRSLTESYRLEEHTKRTGG